MHDNKKNLNRKIPKDELIGYAEEYSELLCIVQDMVTQEVKKQLMQNNMSLESKEKNHCFIKRFIRKICGKT